MPCRSFSHSAVTGSPLAPGEGLGVRFSTREPISLHCSSILCDVTPRIGQLVKLDDSMAMWASCDAQAR